MGTKCFSPVQHMIALGPYLGFPRVPLVPQSTICKTFTILQPNLPCKGAKAFTGPSCATPKPVCRGPCEQASAWMPPTVSQDATQSVWGPTLGSPGHPGSGKIKNILNSTHFGVPGKNTSREPQKRRKGQKNRNSAKMRPFHQTVFTETIWPIYSV